MITLNRILIFMITADMIAWITLESIVFNSFVLLLILIVQIVTIVLYWSQRRNLKSSRIINEKSTKKIVKAGMLNQTTTNALIQAQNVKLYQLRAKVNGLERVVRDQYNEIQQKNDELQALSSKTMRLADYFAHNLKSTSSTLLGLINIEHKIQNLKDRQVIKRKIKSFAEGLNNNLSNVTALLAEETPLNKVCLPELINDVIQGINPNFEVHVASEVNEVLTNATILTEVLLTSLTHFQSGLPEEVKQKIFIAAEQSQNFWTIKISKNGFDPTDGGGSKIENIDRSKILVDKLYGRLDYYSNMMSSVDCIKLTFPIMNNAPTTQDLEGMLMSKCGTLS